LAGENRPNCIDDFNIGTLELTRSLIDAVQITGRNIPIVFSSSIHAQGDGDY
jgi:UDP-2-acetamido-2,6-beta-L-arabino-hexul-4-ose reductase